jgi:hypothetical protein
LPKVPATLSIRVRMTHSQDQGQAPDEIQAFADQIVKEAVPLASIVSQGQRAQNVWTKYRCVRPIVRADLIYTLDTRPWQARVWRTASAELDSAKRMVWAVAPSGTTTYSSISLTIEA